MDFIAENGRSSEFFRRIVMESADAVIAVDAEQKLVLFNHAAEQMFGREREAFLGRPLDELLPPQFRKGHAGKVKAFRDRGERARYMGDRNSHIVGMRADGTEILLGATILTVECEQGPYMVAILRDISERIMFQNELERMASADSMTGVLNRRAFLAALEKEWSRAARYESGLSLLLFDLDRFKSVNDTYGHDVGDRVICRFSELTQSVLRDIDVFGRWGGEEFIAALPHSDLRGARCVAERIREAFSRQSFEGEGFGPFSVTVSVGVADIGGGRVPHQQLVKWADTALYEAKAAGRNQVVVWNGVGGIRVLGDGTSG
jgi:diguanylate cyclase (GGDEF)-like protein/PAS domain S-box-containing protein